MNQIIEPITPILPLVVRPLVAAKMLGISKSVLYEMRREGTLHFLRIGRGVGVSVREIEALVAKAAEEAKLEQRQGLRRPVPAGLRKTKDMQVKDGGSNNRRAKKREVTA